MTLFKGLFWRIRQSRVWIAAQFVGILLLILVCLAWTRVPEKHVWQVVLSLLLPLLVLAGTVVLQAGTMRRLADDHGERVHLAWGALTLLFWVALFLVSWAILDWCEDQIPQASSYFNARFSAHARATVFTFDHIQRWLEWIVWVLRWIILPGKILPYAMASSQWGWRLHWRRVLRILWSWRWWPAIVLAAFVASWLPSQFFAGIPHGTVQAQVWHIAIKLFGAYLLDVCCWVLVLSWLAVLFSRQQPPPKLSRGAGQAGFPVPPTTP